MVLAALAVVGIGLLGFAEHRTAQPDFCGSCHIMEPYYASWTADLHGGKMDIACVECHYAPGERTTVKAKLRGLSQVASYVSGRYGATRPRAHVSNDSCMTAKCHGDGKFMDKSIEVGSVRFSHASHLNLQAESSEKLKKELEETAAALKKSAGEELFARLEEIARQSVPHKQRIDSLEQLAKSSGAALSRDELERYSQLVHREVRLDQLSEIQCTNCHAYGGRIGERDTAAQASHHFSVNMTSCYTCHFNNEGFNTGTNNCLMCHKQLPAGEITVHEQLSAEDQARLNTPELAGATVKMNHQSILERKVDCASCHADVAIQSAPVARRDCERCHDRESYFTDWKDVLSVDQVAKLHKEHVPGQRAKCLDCHVEIHHQLIRQPEQAQGEAAFLTSAISNCAHCHPNHHQEQLSLLSGHGASGVPSSSPNLMFGSRTNCFGCHTEMGADAHGGEVFKATISGCVACHGERHSATFEKWKAGLEVMQTDAEEAFASAQKLLEEASGEIPDDVRRQATELITAAGEDLRLVQRGNGVHNVTYAIDVLDTVTQRSQEASSLIEGARQAPPAEEPQ